MNFHILTLFPDMVMGGLGTSITGRAMESGTISVEAIDIRDYSKDKHRHVDDAPYGGGAGMVMQPGPVCEAYEALCGRIGRKPRLIYMTPQGRVFNQTIAEELAKEEDLVFLCGHYEGIDERALELIATDYLSVGDYVLTGGELPAMVMIDCISRLVPGVLNNDASAKEESFRDSLLEYPQYTRPEVFRGMEVPEVLLSGHHKNIEEWRRQQSIKRTLERRPDLLKQAGLTMKEVKYQLAKEEDLVFLCGHYEGIDERALELIATDYLSVGDYVLTGGELPAMVMIDCISRLVPGVLNNDASAKEESFRDSLLEYPQYTRPEVFRGMEVPEVLLSGHHKNIEEWRRQQSIKRTLERRPDLLKQAGLTMKEVKYLDSLRQEKGDLEILEELLDQYVKALGDEAAAGRIKRKAMAGAKKLLAEKACTVGELEGYYKVMGLLAGG